MAYNYRKAELQWLTWKQQEEQQLRELGMNEDAIQSLRTYDREQFNQERRYLRRWAEAPDAVENCAQKLTEPVPQTLDQLLGNIENEQLLSVLENADKDTLKVILLRVQGYSSKEIAKKTGLTINAVDLRIYRLKKKLKNIF